jgi:hypothetical protein
LVPRNHSALADAPYTVQFCMTTRVWTPPLCLQQAKAQGFATHLQGPSNWHGSPATAPLNGSLHIRIPCSIVYGVGEALVPWIALWNCNWGLRS